MLGGLSAGGSWPPRTIRRKSAAPVGPSRPRAVGTRLTRVAPRRVAAARAPSTEKPGWTSMGVPVTIALVSTESPPTCASGRQASHRSREGSTPRRATCGPRRCLDGAAGEDHALRLAGRPARGDDESVAVLDRLAAGHGARAAATRRSRPRAGAPRRSVPAPVRKGACRGGGPRRPRPSRP